MHLPGAELLELLSVGQRGQQDASQRALTGASAVRFANCWPPGSLSLAPTGASAVRFANCWPPGSLSLAPTARSRRRSYGAAS
jgi:hypothetical protein